MPHHIIHFLLLLVCLCSKCGFLCSCKLHLLWFVCTLQRPCSFTVAFMCFAELLDFLSEAINWAAVASEWLFVTMETNDTNEIWIDSNGSRGWKRFHWLYHCCCYDVSRKLFSVTPVCPPPVFHHPSSLKSAVNHVTQVNSAHVCW